MPASAKSALPFFHVLQDDLRIAFVDDDPILREFALVHLATDTAEVKAAGDGEEALALLDAWPADIMLLDLEMPRLDGFQVLERLRADPRHRELPVIVVTGREDIAAIDRAFASGATSFVPKPLNWRLLSYQIRYVLRASEAEAAARRRMEELARQTVRLLGRVTAPDAALGDLKALLEPLAGRGEAA